MLLYLFFSIDPIARKQKKAQAPQSTTLWTFFGTFWKKLSAERQEQQQIEEIESLAMRQISQKQQKSQLRLKR